MENSLSLQSVVDKYDPKKFDIIVKSEIDETGKMFYGVTLMRVYNILGFKIRKKVKTQKFRIGTNPYTAQLKDFINDIFKDDTSVDFLEYSKFAESGFNENSTNDYIIDLLHCAVGMAGESGEVLELVKKHAFHSTPFDKAKMISELGDYTWYNANFMRLLNINISDVLKGNCIKLTERYPNGRNKNYLANKKDHDRENNLIDKAISEKQ